MVLLHMSGQLSCKLLGFSCPLPPYRSTEITDTLATCVCYMCELEIRTQVLMPAGQALLPTGPSPMPLGFLLIQTSPSGSPPGSPLTI